ncbi:MAG: 1-acyl-sn-glycerol-3-phosphate acyltransferase [Ferruginibacter sp.]
MERLLISIYNFFEKQRILFYIVFAASFLLAGYFALQLKFEEDISKILPKDKKVEKLNEVFQNSKFMDKMVLTVSMKDTLTVAPDSLVMYADSLEQAISATLSPYIKSLTVKTDDAVVLDLYNSISDHLPIYLNEQDYHSIDTLITPVKLRETLAQNFRTLTSPSGIALKQMISNDPVGITFLGLKKLQQLQYDENFELYDNYVVTKDQKHLMIFITPAYPPGNTAKNVKLLEGLDKIINKLSSKDLQNVTASYFGATAVSAGNALQLRRDTIFTQGVTVLFIIIFLAVYFRKKSAPFIILLPVLFGSLFSMAIIYFIKGSISVIALGTGSVVLGIAVNYSLHVFNHYRHTKNIRELIGDLAIPMTIGSLTTIGGFLCLQFVKSDMLKDLGLFAAFSLIGASISSLVFLPHLIDSKKERDRHQSSISWVDRIASFRPEYNKYLVIVILLLTVVFAYWSSKVGFESDLNKMNFMSEKLRNSEQKLNQINQYALQSVYIVTEGITLNDALANNEKLVTKIDKLVERNVVRKYSGVSSLIVSDSMQRLRIDRWNNYWTTEKKQALLDTLEREGARLKFSATAFYNFSSLLEKHFEPGGTEVMADVRTKFLADYITEKPGKATIVTLVKVAPENKPAIYKSFENEAHVTVLDKQYLTSKFVEIINDDFTKIALMTSLLVFFVLLLMYGRIELTLVSFIPMLISWIWILGIMGMADIKFNIINIIVSALIFGLGDDYSLYIMDGLLQEYKTGKKNLSSFKSSIFLSAITTIAGLGVLIFAKHPALQSIALISITGIVCVVIMSQVLIPFFFNLLIKNRVDKKFFPWTFTSFLKSAFAFSFFLYWSITFTVIGRIFARLRVRERGKLLYHKMLSKVAWSLMYIMGNVKKKIINPLNEDLSKPAIIICNHQSSLDIVPLVMLNPRILMFTNNKKWNARFFGPVIRMADYFPAEQVEQNIERIADRMKHGYSFIVFPEGTRSIDGTIGRFHKGAFYLAEQLNADILPIIIHGTDYTLTKKDALLKDGQVTLKYLPRISPSDDFFGNGYADRTKKISRYFREEFNELRNEIEQPSYFKEKLLYNYLYKGPVIEWYLRIKLRLEKNYQLFHDLVPKQGNILDAGCGYGFMSYMLYFTSPKRQVTGIDYDQDKIITANHCFSKTEQINFIHSDITKFSFENYDAIILSDVLHYVSPQEQKAVIERSIDHLYPGGILIIREGDTDETKKQRRTALTEFFSTRLLKFNKVGGAGLSFLSGKVIRELASYNKMSCTEINDSKITSNTIFVLKKLTGQHG